jgi:calcineurin-like phosphoesterase family protein
MAVFFTSDTHFGHGGARGLYRRPFASTAEMDEAMVARWNAVVGSEDEVWHLGDFALGPRTARMEELLGRLNGRKHLLAGNNDGEAARALPGWASVQPYAEMELDGTGLVLCHYPFRSWRNMGRTGGRAWINLHGHSHGRLGPVPRQCDVGVDAWEFAPATLPDILGRLRRRSNRLRRNHKPA